MIDIGDVKIKFWFEKVILDFSEISPAIKWQNAWIQVKNKKGKKAPDLFDISR